MRKVKGKDNQAEMALRRLLWAAGHRYRVHHPVPDLRRCSIDVAFPGRKVAVFVDGCFWHSCPDHGRTPKTNAGFWAAKLAHNAARDANVTWYLRHLGWTVLRFWTHCTAAEMYEVVAEALNG
jgi:DNA mismatch endonuclease (patch repair protein)